MSAIATYVQAALSFVTGAQVQAQTYTYFTTGGSSTAYTLTPTPALGALATGDRFRVAFHTAAGATPTLAVSGLAAKNLKYKDATGTKQAVTSTQIPSNWISDVEYDGTDMLVMDVPPAAAAIPLSTVTTAGDLIVGTGASAVARLAMGSALQQLRVNAGATALEFAAAGGIITIGTPQLTTSGTIWTFASLPSTARMVGLILNQFSTNGSSNPIAQIGPVGGVETSGYLGACGFNSTNAAASAGALLANSVTSATILNGIVVFFLENSTSNTWGWLTSMGESDAAIVFKGGGIKPLAGALSKIALTLTNGTDAGDLGEVNCFYL
jgi:hypothetical protein